MNERINALIKQSYVTDHSWIAEGRTYFSQEKFAELIVRECAKLCHDQALIESEKGSVKSSHKEQALDDIGCKIAKHFGVEE